MTISPTATEIEPMLAQTQCTECGFDGCGPYAEALASGEAEINLCRPGGERVLKNLARAFGRDIENEDLKPAKPAKIQVAEIDADKCIGCTLCIQACPTDSILGAPKQLHAVLAADCTGCALCVPVCPVDCIDFTAEGATPDSAARAPDVRQLINAKKERKARRWESQAVDATLSGKIKDMDYSQATDLSLTISPEMQAKMDAARGAAKQKWTEKKTPATPRELRKK